MVVMDVVLSTIVLSCVGRVSFSCCPVCRFGCCQSLDVSDPGLSVDCSFEDRDGSRTPPCLHDWTTFSKGGDMKSNADLLDVLAPLHHLTWLLVSSEDTALELVGGSTWCSWDRTEFP